MNAGNTQPPSITHHFPFLPSPPLFLSLLPCVSPLCFCLEVEPIVLDSLPHHWKSSSTCDAEQAKKHRNMSRLQQRWFREEECSILYAGRISLIEVSAWENCGCVRVNVWVRQKLHSSQRWWGIWLSLQASFDCVCVCVETPPHGDANCKTYHLVYLWCWDSKVEAVGYIITLHHWAITLRIHS